MVSYERSQYHMRAHTAYIPTCIFPSVRHQTNLCEKFGLETRPPQSRTLLKQSTNAQFETNTPSIFSYVSHQQFCWHAHSMPAGAWVLSIACSQKQSTNVMSGGSALITHHVERLFWTVCSRKRRLLALPSSLHFIVHSFSAICI